VLKTTSPIGYNTTNNKTEQQPQKQKRLVMRITEVIEKWFDHNTLNGQIKKNLLFYIIDCASVDVIHNQMWMLLFSLPDTGTFAPNENPS
jgi:hypothetical protein